jgi:hypothetical protein
MSGIGKMDVWENVSGMLVYRKAHEGRKGIQTNILQTKLLRFEVETQNLASRNSLVHHKLIRTICVRAVKLVASTPLSHRAFYWEKQPLNRALSGVEGPDYRLIRCFPPFATWIPLAGDPSQNICQTSWVAQHLDFQSTFPAKNMVQDDGR